MLLQVRSGADGLGEEGQHAGSGAATATVTAGQGRGDGVGAAWRRRRRNRGRRAEKKGIDFGEISQVLIIYTQYWSRLVVRTGTNAYLWSRVVPPTGTKGHFWSAQRAGSRDLWSRFVPPTGTNAYLWSRLVARTGTKGGYWSRLVPPTGTNGLRLAQRMFSPTSLAEGRQYWFISAGVPPLSSSSLKQALGPKPFSASGPTGLSVGLHPGPKNGWVSSRMQAMVAQ